MEYKPGIGIAHACCEHVCHVRRTPCDLLASLFALVCLLLQFVSLLASQLHASAIIKYGAHTSAHIPPKLPPPPIDTLHAFPCIRTTMHTAHILNVTSPPLKHTRILTSMAAVECLEHCMNATTICRSLPVHSVVSTSEYAHPLARVSSTAILVCVIASPPTLLFQLRLQQ